ncbi:MAG: hypothetical protein ACPHID_00995 [Thermoplasmatota archaeon]
MVGHYGTPALVAGGLTIALLIVHLAVPFAVVDYSAADNDAGIDDETLSLKDMGDRLKAAPDQYGLSGLGLIMTGLILALVGSLVLVILGFVPLPTTAARFLGWGFGFVGAMGAFFAGTASLFHVGAGFTTFLGLVGASDATRLWIISPVITATGSIVALAFLLKIMGNVVTRNDDLRMKAQNILRAPFLAVIVLAALLVMPLSIQAINGDERAANGASCAAEGCEGTYEFWSAGGSTSSGNTLGILAYAESTEDGAEVFQGLAMTIKVTIAAAWVAFFVGAFATLGHVITSVTGVSIVTKIFGAFQLANVITLPWAVVQLILAMAFQTWRPAEEAVLDALPSFAAYSAVLPVVALAAVVMLGLRLVWNLIDTFGNPKELVEKSQAQAVSFD